MPTDAGQVMYEAAARLLESAYKSTGLGKGEEVVRLIGVGAATLVHTDDLVIRLPSSVGKKSAAAKPARPPSVDSTEDAPLVSHERDNRLNASLDQIRERYGFSAIAPATTVKRP